MLASSPKKIGPLNVILDSNALYVPLEFKIDIFEELRNLLNRKIDFVLLSTVKRELDMLTAKESPKIRREAIFALKLAEKCKYGVYLHAPLRSGNASGHGYHYRITFTAITQTMPSRPSSIRSPLPPTTNSPTCNIQEEL